MRFFSCLSKSSCRISGISSKFLSNTVKLAIEGLDRSVIFQEADGYNIPREQLIKIISYLENKGILFSRSVPIKRRLFETPEQYVRQVEFFQLFESSKSTAEQINHEILKKKILIVGLGGYGTWLTLLFSQIGIGTIIGIDFDKVEHSNLNRQILYSENDIGKFKTDACREFVKRHFSHTDFQGVNLKIQSPHDLIPYLREVDLVVYLAGYRPLRSSFNNTEFIITSTCIEHQVSCMAIGGNWIGPLYVPTKTPCYFCALENLQALKKNASSLDKMRIGSFAPFIAQTASIVVWEAVAHLCSLLNCKTYQNLIMLNRFETGISNTLLIQRNLDCPCCQV